jgi:cytochrome c-type biogenesis protein CcmH
MEALIKRLQERLASEPGNAEGWVLLARSQSAMGNYAEASEAYAKAVGLSERQPDVLAGYAEMLVKTHDGTVTPQARQLFAEVLTNEPESPPARFYLGLAKLQGGDGKAALADWLALAAAAPPDAPWLSGLRGQIEAVAKEFNIDLATVAPNGPALVASLPQAAAAPAATGAPGPTAADVANAQNLSDDQRSDMIRGMVARLAQRLENEPNDLEGWRRLGHAYTVLGDNAKAADALAHAATLAPDNADVLVEYGEALAEAAPGGRPPPQALDAMRRALALDGQRSEALWMLGFAAADAGDKAAAVDLLGRLLTRLSPASAEYAEAKARLDQLSQVK